MSKKPFELEVTEQSTQIFVVNVATGHSRTTHTVTVSSGLGAEVGNDKTTDRVLVEESFRFLLEREPNTSIMRAFDIEVIGRYFPEWRDEMTRRLSDR
jgi:hypothetical protein